MVLLLLPPVRLVFEVAFSEPFCREERDRLESPLPLLLLLLLLPLVFSGFSEDVAREEAFLGLYEDPSVVLVDFFFLVVAGLFGSDPDEEDEDDDDPDEGDPDPEVVRDADPEVSVLFCFLDLGGLVSESGLTVVEEVGESKAEKEEERLGCSSESPLGFVFFDFFLGNGFGDARSDDKPDDEDEDDDDPDEDEEVVEDCDVLSLVSSVFFVSGFVVSSDFLSSCKFCTSCVVWDSCFTLLDDSDMDSLFFKTNATRPHLSQYGCRYKTLSTPSNQKRKKKKERRWSEPCC